MYATLEWVSKWVSELEKKSEKTYINYSMNVAKFFVLFLYVSFLFLLLRDKLFLLLPPSSCSFLAPFSIVSNETKQNK